MFTNREHQISFVKNFINQNTKYYIQATLINNQNTKTLYKTAPFSTSTDRITPLWRT